MKNKTYTEPHYNYVNQIIQIFGFVNLADFSFELTFEHVKNKTAIICENLNKSFVNLKELFVVKEFDLTRLDYKLETAEQAYSFLKKLLDHVFIPYETFRLKGCVGLRLIPPNKFYIDYINKMSEIVHNSIQNPELSQNENQIEAITWSETIIEYGTKKFLLEYIFGSKLVLNDLKDKFDCVDKIYFSIYGETDEAKALELARKHVITVKIGDKIRLKVDLQHCIPIELFDLPIGLLNFNEISIEIFPASGEKELWDKFETDPVLFKVFLSCCKFKKSMPKYISESKIYLDKLTKDMDLSKYFIQKGMIVLEEKNSVITQLDKTTNKLEYLEHPFDRNPNEPIYKFIQYMIETGKLSEREKIIQSKNIKIVSFDNSKEDDSKIKENELDDNYEFLVNMFNFKKYGYSFISRTVLNETEQERIFEPAIEFNKYENLSVQYIERASIEEHEPDQLGRFTYYIDRCCDAYSAIYPPKRNYDYILNINSREYLVKAGVELVIHFDNFLTQLGTSDQLKLKILTQKKNIKDWINPTFKFKCIYYDTKTRSMVAQEKINSNIKI